MTFITIGSKHIYKLNKNKIELTPSFKCHKFFSLCSNITMRPTITFYVVLDEHT